MIFCIVVIIMEQEKSSKASNKSHMPRAICRRFFKESPVSQFFEKGKVDDERNLRRFFLSSKLLAFEVN